MLTYYPKRLMTRLRWRSAWPKLASVILGIVACSSALPAQAAEFDPRLGSPFARRPRPSLGSATAPIVVVEVASYKCLHCQQFHRHVFPQLRETYIGGGKVQWFLLPASLESGDEYAPVFPIGRCLDRQGKLWSMMDFLMENGGRPVDVLDDAIANNPAIDNESFQMCEREFTLRQVVLKDFAECRDLKIRGTPVFFVRKALANGQRAEATVQGYQTYEYFQKLFDQLLARQ